jgi:hypothetical protein
MIKLGMFDYTVRTLLGKVFFKCSLLDHTAGQQMQCQSSVVPFKFKNSRF